jgi:ketosteroid isomerase-like protein
MWNAVANFDWSPKLPGDTVPDQLVSSLNAHDIAFVPKLYTPDAAHVTGARTAIGVEAIQNWYTQLFGELLPGASFQITSKNVAGRTAHFTWNAASDRGRVLDGNDTLSLRDGKIQYHYTYFTLT